MLGQSKDGVPGALSKEGAGGTGEGRVTRHCGDGAVLTGRGEGDRDRQAAQARRQGRHPRSGSGAAPPVPVTRREEVPGRRATLWGSRQRAGLRARLPPRAPARLCPLRFLCKWRRVAQGLASGKPRVAAAAGAHVHDPEPNASLFLQAPEDLTNVTINTDVNINELSHPLFQVLYMQ